MGKVKEISKIEPINFLMTYLILKNLIQAY